MSDLFSNKKDLPEIFIFKTFFIILYIKYKVALFPSLLVFYTFQLFSIYFQLSFSCYVPKTQVIANMDYSKSTKQILCNNGWPQTKHSYTYLKTIDKPSNILIDLLIYYANDIFFHISMGKTQQKIMIKTKKKYDKNKNPDI